MRKAEGLLSAKTIKGQALDSFLLKKYGLHWDGVPQPHLKISNLEDNSFKLFIKKGLQSGRLDSSSEQETKEQLCAKLNLFDGSYLKRAAALLFCEEPEQFGLGAYVKIGFFRTNTDLLYQDEIRGNIFSQVDKTVEMLTTKYMKAYIHYEGIQRIERLLGRHPSIPNNPLLAAAFFRAGYIESWGRGIEKIKTECKMAEAMEPEIQYAFGGVEVTFTGEIPVTSESREPINNKSTLKSSESTLKTPAKIREIIENDKIITIPQIAEKLGLTTWAIKKQMSKLQAKGIIKRIGPDKGGHWEVAGK